MNKKLSVVFSKKNFILYLIIFFSLFLLYLLLYFVFGFSIKLVYCFYFFVFYSVFFYSIFFFIDLLKKQNIYKEINRELPFFLNNLGNDLDKGIDFRRALENRTLDNTILSKRIKQALENTNLKGFNIKDSLQEICSDNNELKEIIIQIIDIMEFGSRNKSYSLKIISSNLITKQNLKLKNFSSKLNLITLIYIVISTILPAMILIFFIIGSNFFELNFSNFSVIFIITILFPLIDMFLLFFLKTTVP
jgi:hypothetical protein